jgi:hypothetical protein
VLTHLIIISLACNGIYIASNAEGMIFTTPARWLTQHLPHIFIMPLFDCITCMASFWTLAYALLVCHQLLSLEILFAIPAVAFMNNIFYSILEKLNNGDN